MKRRTSLFLKVISGIVLIVLIAMVVGASFYMLHFSINNPAGKDMTMSRRILAEEFPRISQWADSMESTKTLKDTFIVVNNVRLHALYAHAASPTKHTAFIIHGYTCNAYRFLHIAYMFYHSLGYNVFLPDLHAHGRSGGNDIQMGWKDADDVMSWLPVADKIFGQGTDAEIVVHGTSMGGATAMNVSGIENFPFVKCYIEDSGYSSVWDELQYQLKEYFGLPSFPLMYTTSTLCGIKYGWRFGDASSVDRVHKCHKPMLFIHSDSDKFVPTWMVYQLYASKPAPKMLWIVHKSEHAKAYHDYSKEYTSKVNHFVNMYVR